MLIRRFRAVVSTFFHWTIYRHMTAYRRLYFGTSLIHKEFWWVTKCSSQLDDESSGPRGRWEPGPSGLRAGHGRLGGRVGDVLARCEGESPKRRPCGGPLRCDFHRPIGGGSFEANVSRGRQLSGCRIVDPGSGETSDRRCEVKRILCVLLGLCLQLGAQSQSRFPLPRAGASQCAQRRPHV